MFDTIKIRIESKVKGDWGGRNTNNQIPVNVMQLLAIWRILTEPSREKS